jgi:hypothetical protein
MTRGEITGRVQAWLGLQSIDDFDEIPLIHDLIYRGTVDLLSRTRCVARCVHLNTSASVAEYVLDHSILSLVDVEDGARRRARRDQTTDNTFTLIRSDLLRINPAPSADGEVDVWAVLLPQKMAADTDALGTEGADGRGGRLAQIRTLINKRGTARAADRRVTLPGVAGRQAWF